jgi:hypothetical protein
MSPKRLTSTLVRTEAILLAHLAAAPSRAVDKVSNFAPAPMLREEKLKQGFSFGPPALRTSCSPNSRKSLAALTMVEGSQDTDVLRILDRLKGTETLIAGIIAAGDGKGRAISSRDTEIAPSCA